jgi:caspase domain-containing protein/von Hippel-Lindau disease tumor suppressor protein
LRIAAGLIALLLLCLVSQPAAADRRVALVIGNGGYLHAPHLPNPPHDAEDVAAALKRTGFETIIGLDLDKNKMEDAAIKFARAARNADVAIFYYSGHALQYAGVNYLIPIDAQLADEADLRRATRVDDILEDLKQAKNLRILVLDSCRDNPLADQLKRSIGTTRSTTIQRGLARIESPDGTIISYSTQAGRTAADGDGRNSPYTTAFLKHIEEKEDISTVFHHISADVYSVSGGGQVPELSLSFFGEFYLNGRLQVTLTPGKPAPADPCAAAAEHWKSAEAVGTPAAFEDHLTRFSNCAYAGLARARLDDLKGKDKAKQNEIELAFWNSIKDRSDAAGFRDFLTRFPDGVFATLARDRLAALSAPRAGLAAPAGPSADDAPAAGADASCASEPRMKSQTGNRPVTLTFKNVSSEALSAYWLDYGGKRVFYRRLGGGESYVQPTYMTHPWVFVDASGKCHMVVLPDPGRSLVSVR